MRAFTCLFLLSAACGFKVSAHAQNETLTITEASDQLASYVELLKNGSVGVDAAGLSQSALPTGCALACSFLNFIAPDKISYPGSTVFIAGEAGYWSAQQEAVQSTCRFSPASALDVSTAILVFQVVQCKFAAKGGGHAAFAGASNIEDGVTIDLVNLNEIVVRADGKLTGVGAGNRWMDVYQKLQPLGLTVTGGRVSDIGSGLVLGGGISFLSARVGWACDNVENYQVVFADGTIRDVSYAIYPDLFYALRGGGNNFGIVTRFDMVTYPQGLMWGGTNLYPYAATTEAALNAAFSNLNVNNAADPYAQAILAFAYYQPYDSFLISSQFTYGKPVVNPPILQPFTAVQGNISSTLDIQNLTGLVEELASHNPDGFRQSYWALMTKDSSSLMADMTAIWMDEVDRIKNVSSFLPSISYQPISTAMTSHFTKEGGNALGISAADGPLNLLNIVWKWNNTSDDAAVMQAARNVFARCNETAYNQGLGYRFLYQNYASREQPVFESYGEESLERLRKASRKYDPSGVWWRLQPGYFKLGL